MAVIRLLLKSFSVSLTHAGWSTCPSVTFSPNLFLTLCWSESNQKQFHALWCSTCLSSLMLPPPSGNHTTSRTHFFFSPKDSYLKLAHIIHKAFSAVFPCCLPSPQRGKIMLYFDKFPVNILTHLIVINFTGWCISFFSWLWVQQEQKWSLLAPAWP